MTTNSPWDDLGDDIDPSLDEEFPLGDGVADLSSQVSCPYCGEPVEITLDPGSGSHQQYVEDCYVCCRPWLVSVSYDEHGVADVHIDANDDA
ncbi:MAG: CPXCG motif-containing cysteine-rich protein [Gemmatimonadota bacterium]